MPEVVIHSKIKGRKGEVEADMLASSLSDFVVLPMKVAKAIDPEPLGYEEELEVGGGGRISGPLCVIELEVKDLETGEKRKEKVKAVILEKEKRCVMGIEALEKLGIILDLKKGKFKFG